MSAIAGILFLLGATASLIAGLALYHRPRRPLWTGSWWIHQGVALAIVGLVIVGLACLADYALTPSAAPYRAEIALGGLMYVLVLLFVGRWWPRRGRRRPGEPIQTPPG